MYILSIFMAVVSGVIYHLSMRSTTTHTNPSPFLLLLFAYFFAAIFTLTICLIFQVNILEPLRLLLTKPWSFISQDFPLKTAIAIGFAIVGIELGFLLAYQNGWSVLWAPLVANASVTLLLLPIGLVHFKEQFTFEKLLGAALCFVGIYLISKR